jgi:hypothetical protein
MKFEQYLTDGYQLPEKTFEQQQANWKDFVKPTLIKDCKKFYKEKTMLFRGSGYYPDAITFMTARTDRNPMNTARSVQIGFDKASEKAFGFKARSGGVFCTPQRTDASAYGTMYMIAPKGDFKYIWSAEITDFYGFTTKQRKVIYNPEYDFDALMKDHYTDKNLKGSKKAKAEVMLYCPNGYYLIDPSFEEAVIQEFNL